MQSLFRVSRKTQALRLEGEGGLPEGVVCGASAGTLVTAAQQTGARAVVSLSCCVVGFTHEV